MVANKKTNTFLATQKPIIILKQDKDSIYITGRYGLFCQYSGFCFKNA